MSTSLKDKALKLRKNGYTYLEISIELNCKKSTIGEWCRKSGMTGRVDGKPIKIEDNLIEEINKFYLTHTIKETANNFCIGISTVKKYTLNKGKCNKYIIKNDMRICKNCNKILHIDNFYLTKKGKNKQYSGFDLNCKKCSSKLTHNRMVNVKIKMINFKGGKCERCTLTLENSHYSVFDFHHVIPSEKDVKASKMKYQSWDYIQNELNKCQLLCSNCHRIAHAKLHLINKNDL